MITERDKQIIDLLQEQGFCFYKDITKKFFPSEVAACNRLKKLSLKGWITIEPIHSTNLSSIIDDNCSLHLMGQNKKIVRLNDKHKIIKRKVSRRKIKNQLVLLSLKERLENFLSQVAVFKHEVKVKPTFYNGDYEPLPDFYLKGENYKLAVELDLHLKRNSRYNLKIAEYGKSSFTHVLYFVTNAKKMNSLIRDFSYRQYVGIAHYSNEQEIFCYRYGRVTLDDWLKKRVKLSSDSSSL